MTRKIIFIIIGALLFLLLLGLLWFWFLHRSPAAPANTATSGFGTSTDKTATNGSGSTSGGQTNLASGSAQGTANSGGINTNGSGINTAGSGINTGTGTPTPGTNSDSETGTVAVTGGINSGAWVGSNAAERDFTPAQINQLNDAGSVGGTPLISTTPQSAGLGTSGLILGAAAAGCAAQYAANYLLGKLPAVAEGPASIPLAGPYVVVYDYNANAKANANKFTDIETCLVKTIAQAAVDQITRSVVTWINSGFNGKPSFVTNFNQYFANVADQAAGAFIQSSALSFLCSPFAPQIKIAIAQSYANRNNAATCSLTKVVNNINGFLAGNWAGWGGLLQFTTVPTNNPYGAYAYAQIGLNSSISSAQGNANRNVSPSGFISLQKQSCTTVTGSSAPATPPGGSVSSSGNSSNGLTNYQVCQSTVTTPGDVIQSSLNSSLNNPVQGLNLAQDINSIISALTNQVMIRALYGGLGNALGVTNPLAPAIDQGASAQAQALLAELQNFSGYAGQYGNVEQGSISDIQIAQSNLNSLYNCWSVAASSTALTTAQQTQASANATAADSAESALGTQVDAFNNEITRANNSLATIQNLQSQVLFAATPDDVTAAAQAINAAGASGVFLSQDDVTTAQQNRTTLQAGLAAQNQQTQAGLTQCQAFGN